MSWLRALFFLTFLSPVATIFLSGELMAMPKAMAPTAVETISGTVVETMNAAGYTYMLVKTEDNQDWVAIPATSIVKGIKVSYYKGMIMNDFFSKTLNRTFTSINFSPGLVTLSEEEIAKNTTGEDSFAAAIEAEKRLNSPALTMEASAGSTGAIVPHREISVEKSTAINGYSVAELFARAKELAGKKIQVRAKVVKFNPSIMGTNWAHLQDGTGNPMNNSHDLVLTTDEVVELDSIVTLEGTLAVEKDFGAGYKYSVIIEKATIVHK